MPRAAARLARAVPAAVLLALCAPAVAGKPAPLALQPGTASVAAGSTVTFAASGGEGGYVYALSVNASGGAVDPETGVYTAGPAAGADTVTVTDAAGTRRTATVQVSATASAPVDGETDLGGHR